MEKKSKKLMVERETYEKDGKTINEVVKELLN